MDDYVSRENIINIIKSLPNANPSYSHTCDVIDRADLLYLVERAATCCTERNILLDQALDELDYLYDYEYYSPYQAQVQRVIDLVKEAKER